MCKYFSRYRQKRNRPVATVLRITNWNIIIRPQLAPVGRLCPSMSPSRKIVLGDAIPAAGMFAELHTADFFIISYYFSPNKHKAAGMKIKQKG